MTTTNSQERKTTLMKPCGHAAPVDSRAPHLARLPTSAWTAQRRPYAHRAGDDIRFAKNTGNNDEALEQEGRPSVNL
jgi:hypothetical protein